MTEPAPAIRTAVPADLPALQRVYRAASLSNAGDAPKLLARPEFLHFKGERIASGRTLVALAGPPGSEHIAGFATVTGDAELEDLFVDPDFRRRGLARHLVERVAALARDAGHPRLWVIGNTHALAFYLAAGFVQTGEVTTELGPGLRMCLELRP